MEEERGTFEAVRLRLDEIVEAVNAEDVTLDEALALYEEAVKLGLSACDLSEKDVEAAALAEDALTDAAEDETEAAGAEEAPEPAEAPAADEAAAPEGADLPSED